MAFQVRVRVNKMTIKVLSVASTREEFEKFTIRDLKRKALSLFPGVNDPDRLRVIFGQTEPEDNRTFQSCDIEHQSLLVVVLLMPGLPQPRDETCGKASGTLGMFDWWKISRSVSQRSAEQAKEKRDPVPQSTEPEPSPITERSSSGEADIDLQFLHSLLPALKRMDLRRREFAKAAIHQLVFQIEFNDNLTSDIDSMAAEAVRRLQASVWGQDGGRASSVSSDWSMKSEASLPHPPDFSTGPTPDCRSSSASSVYSEESDKQIPHHCGHLTPDPECRSSPLLMRKHTLQHTHSSDPDYNNTTDDDKSGEMIFRCA